MATVLVRPPPLFVPWRDVGLDMLRRGLATTYKAKTGAEEDRRRVRGLWAAEKGGGLFGLQAASLLESGSSGRSAAPDLTSVLRSGNPIIRDFHKDFFPPRKNLRECNQLGNLELTEYPSCFQSFRQIWLPLTSAKQVSIIKTLLGSSDSALTKQSLGYYLCYYTHPIISKEVGSLGVLVKGFIDLVVL